jgi:hypothetical protein
MVNPIFERDVALRRVLRAARVVPNQTRFVEKLRAKGQPTGEAEADLAAFRASLRTYEGDLAVADKAFRILRSRCS